jgi:hypothetical protein
MTSKQKAYAALIAFAFICVIGGAIIYGNHQRDAYLQAKGEAKAKSEALEAYKKGADAQIAALSSDIANLTKQRDAAIAQANDANGQKTAIQLKYEALKRETASLPADALSSNLNARLGTGETWPTAGGLFSFTRPGAERTLNLFLDGDEARGKLEASEKESASLRSALSLSAGETAAWRDKYSLKDGELTRTVEAWTATKDALRHLERSIPGRKLKSFIYGTAVGVIAGAVIYSKIKK